MLLCIRKLFKFIQDIQIIFNRIILCSLQWEMVENLLFKNIHFEYDKFKEYANKNASILYK